MDPKLQAIAEAAKGFLPSDEGVALYEAGLQAAAVGPLLEIGTYCGKSAVYLGAAARDGGTVLFTIDHHRGSEEIQPGWEHHDPDLVHANGQMDSLPFFRATIATAGLERVVVGIVGDASTVAKHWTSPLGLLFIDGAHAEDLAMADYEAWAAKIAPGGALAIHDVFEDPSEGGRGPYLVYQRALEERFIEFGSTGSLRVLQASR